MIYDICVTGSMPWSGDSANMAEETVELQKCRGLGYSRHVHSSVPYELRDEYSEEQQNRYEIDRHTRHEIDRHNRYEIDRQN